jgi:hypothetical protein
MSTTAPRADAAAASVCATDLFVLRRRGVVLVAHTDAGPRGFTLLCRRLGLRLADVASAQLGVALTQEWCSKEADRLHSEFGKLDAS